MVVVHLVGRVQTRTTPPTIEAVIAIGQPANHLTCQQGCVWIDLAHYEAPTREQAEAGVLAFARTQHGLGELLKRVYIPPAGTPAWLQMAAAGGPAGNPGNRNAR